MPPSTPVETLTHHLGESEDLTLHKNLHMNWSAMT